MKKQHTIYGILGIVLGIIGGVAGTAFSMGAGQQRFKDAILHNSSEIETIKIDVVKSAKVSQKEIDRNIGTVSDKISELQKDISTLTNIVTDLRTDVHVLKVLLERIEQNK